MRPQFLAAAFVLIPSLLSAQPTQLPLQLDLDGAVFAYDEQHSMVEVYLSVEAAGLQFREYPGGFISELPMEIEVIRKSDAHLQSADTAPVWEDDSSIGFAVQDTSALGPGQFFTHQFRTLLAPGEYVLQIHLPADSDENRGAIDLHRDLIVPDFNREQPAISEATLASDIRPTAERGSPFYKNGLIVRPNANRLYGQGLSRLFYYAEAYGVDQLGGEDGKYTLYAYVSEANRNQPVEGLESRVDRPAQSPDVLVGSFDLSSVPSGAYFLHLALLNEGNQAVAETSRKLFVYNPGVAPSQTVFLEETFETSEYASMPEEQVAKGLAYARLIATDQERRRIRSLEALVDKQRFLMDFWKARDPNPASPLNEYREQFLQRVEFANQRYGNNYQEGWETDRGRVLIRYGQPISIEPNLYDRELIPHEVWHYDNIPGEGQSIFVFADRTSFGQFELIHSSVTGERSLPTWQEELQRR